MIRIETFLPHVVTGLAGASLALGVMFYTQPAQLPHGIVTIDASEAVLKFVQAGGRDMKDAEYEKVALQYQQELEAAIQRFAMANGVIVVNGATVLAGAPDITDLVSTSALEAFRAANGAPARVAPEAEQ